jgi:predicted aspartyl protease
VTGIIKRWLLRLTLIAVGNYAIADTCHIEKHATLPITFDGSIPTVPVTINGHQMNFEIDTGSQYTLVSPDLAQQLTLPLIEHSNVNIHGSDGDHKARAATIRSLGFGRDEFRGKIVIVLPVAQPVPSKQSDLKTVVPIAGLIGADMLYHYEIEYDPPAHTFTLYFAHNCNHAPPPWHGGYESLPVVLTKERQFLMPVTLNNRELHATFDTGANNTLLALISAKGLGVTDEILARERESHVTGAAGAVRPSRLHRFDSFRIGYGVFDHPRIWVLDFHIPGVDMLLGEDYMRSRRFWLSYSMQMLYVQFIN